MYSHMKRYQVQLQSGSHVTVMVTAQRIANDINGNPRHKTFVWLWDETKLNGHLWSPKVKGYRRSKDDSFILKNAKSLEHSMDNFMTQFEESINE